MKFISAALSVAVWLLTISSAYAVSVIDTTGASFIGLLSFGEPGTATYGQTFTATGPELQLDSFMFRFDDYSSLSDQDAIDFAAYVYAWNGSMATGPQLYSSGVISSTNNGGAGGFEVFSFNTGGIQLVDGQQYVVFLSTSLFFDGLSGHSAWELSNSDAYNAGNFVHINNGNDFSLLFNSPWEDASPRDLWFKANFSVPVPVQPTLVIEKLTNNNQADSANDPDVPRIAQGETVTWSYHVTNIGEVDVSEAEIVVTDSQPGVSPALDTNSDTGGDLILSPGEIWTYTATGQALDLSTPPADVTVVPGCDDGRNTYENTGRVEISGTEVFDEDLSHYCNPANHDPSLYVDYVEITVNEGETATNTGTWIDPDSDTVTLSASVGTIINNNGGSWSWSWDTTDGPTDSQTVTITADDGNGGITSVAFDLTVNNVPPTVDLVTVPTDPVAITAQPVYVTAEFSDPAYTLDQHTATIDFGDGQGGQPIPVGDGTISATYTYGQSGVYPITVTVTDKDGGVGVGVATNYIVIYDATDGFVTGGGWIDSPASACTEFCGGATGHATFGLVSGYKRGATKPTGKTHFNFAAGGLKFDSDNYDWLVVNQGGANAQFKGFGTINGQLDASGQPYRFMVWAGDGETDTFRIRIWSELSGVETVIYDNGVNQPLGGGSIAIHT